MMLLVQRQKHAIYAYSFGVTLEDLLAFWGTFHQGTNLLLTFEITPAEQLMIILKSHVSFELSYIWISPPFFFTK